MSDTSKTTIDKLKIISELSNDSAVKQLILVLREYISTNDERGELGFINKKTDKDE